MINLANVMNKYLFSLGYLQKKKDVFIDIFTYCNIRNWLIFHSKYIQSDVSLIVISVDNNDVAEGKKRGRLASNNHC